MTTPLSPGLFPKYCIGSRCVDSSLSQTQGYFQVRKSMRERETSTINRIMLGLVVEVDLQYNEVKILCIKIGTNFHYCNPTGRSTTQVDTTTTTRTER